MSETIKYIARTEAEIRRYYLSEDYAIPAPIVMAWLRILRQKAVEDEEATLMEIEVANEYD